MSGAMFQMIAHGLSSAGMFFLVGVVYDRVHHRNLDQFGGLFGRMPVYSGISMGIFFAALGLPGLCGFIGEFFVVLGAWSYSKALAIVAASVVILTAGYILWTIQRVYLGPEYKGPHAEALTPMSRREVAIAAPLLALAILFGVYPRALFDYIDAHRAQERDRDGRLDGQRSTQSATVAGAATAVNFDALVQSVMHDTGGASLGAFRPELTLCATIVAFLLVRSPVPRWTASAFASRCWGSACRSAWPFLGIGSRAAFRPASRRSSPARLVADSFTVVMRGCCCCFRPPVHDLHANRRRSRTSARHDRVLRADARRVGGHVPDDFGQPLLHGGPGGGDGQRAVLRAGRNAAEPRQEQRGRAEIRGFRRGHGGHHALWNEPAGRRARHGPSAHHGRPPGRADPQRRTAPTGRWCWSSAD